VSVLPLGATVSAGQVSASNITLYQGANVSLTWSITDDSSDESPVNLNGKTILFTVQQLDRTTVKWQQSSTDGSISVGSTDYNQVTVSVASTDTLTDGAYLYNLRNGTDDKFLARGAVTIEREANSTAAVSS